MRTKNANDRARTQLTLLLICAAVLLLLSFLPSSHAAVSSSETRFSEISAHGLNIIPASCASSPSYYHLSLAKTSDTYGFILPSNGDYNGGYSASAGEYVCAYNGSGSTYFIPALTASELNNFKAHPPPGTIVY